MVAVVLGGCPDGSAVLRAVVEEPGIGPAEALRSRVRRDRAGSGRRPGTATGESARIEAVEKEAAGLERVNGILKAAAGFFAAGPGRPHLRS
ncbi:hypothetical protein [Kitasatospora sp. NPDC088134]|uniref:hypothetical protein n=1 Tax=Kitasatospora sp. NPDC088134 TaxID=3364071 RepID=UPI0037F33EE6